jgi:hypothetical protein
VNFLPCKGNSITPKALRLIKKKHFCNVSSWLISIFWFPYEVEISNQKLVNFWGHLDVLEPMLNSCLPEGVQGA